MTLSNSLGSDRHTQSAITQKHTHTHTSVWQLCEVTCVFAVLQACCHTKTLRSLEEAHLSQRPVNKILSCHSQQARIFFNFFYHGWPLHSTGDGKMQQENKQWWKAPAGNVLFKEVIMCCCFMEPRCCSSAPAPAFMTDSLLLESVLLLLLL